ncbi:MAG: hypothetical protein M1815_003312 [Lichina confinis]|nr:MAG: hypothetical protein M1815_003312 [Lichina confinis]
MTVYRDGAKQGGLSHLTARIVFLAAQQAMARARARARRGAPLIPFGRAEAGRVHAWIPAWRQSGGAEGALESIALDTEPKATLHYKPLREDDYSAQTSSGRRVKGDEEDEEDE